VALTGGKFHSEFFRPIPGVIIVDSMEARASASRLEAMKPQAPKDERIGKTFFMPMPRLDTAEDWDLSPIPKYVPGMVCDTASDSHPSLVLDVWEQGKESWFLVAPTRSWIPEDDKFGGIVKVEAPGCEPKVVVISAAALLPRLPDLAKFYNPNGRDKSTGPQHGMHFAQSVATNSRRRLAAALGFKTSVGAFSGKLSEFLVTSSKGSGPRCRLLVRRPFWLGLRASSERAITAALQKLRTNLRTGEPFYAPLISSDTFETCHPSHPVFLIACDRKSTPLFLPRSLVTPTTPGDEATGEASPSDVPMSTGAPSEHVPSVSASASSATDTHE
jgi:hypothetical protein